MKELVNKFESLFSKKAEHRYFSPGRINLIGEHIDYHGGKVLPAAISLGTYALVAKRNDKKIRLYSENFSEQGIYEFDLSDLKYEAQDDWTNYPKGSIQVLIEAGYKLPHGFDILYYGNIPNGAGLSSSASIEVLTIWIMNQIFDLQISRTDVALLAQKAENEFVGVNCGIMDQFAVAKGKQGQAMLLDTGTVTCDYVPAIFEDASIVIMNTNKKRGLEDSDYNTRRLESEKAFELLQPAFGVDYLSEINVADLAKVKEILQDDVLYRRAKHVITENNRTYNAFAALENNDLVTFGKLLNESHLSLRDNYEVTGKALDTLAENAWQQKGVYGARMTGAGFGGAAIALVKNDDSDAFIDKVSIAYKEEMGYEADFYIANIGDGVFEL